MGRLIQHEAQGPAVIQVGDQTIFVCQCGLSKNKPFCDGSHRATKDEEKGAFYIYDGQGGRVKVSDMFPAPTKKFSPPE